ncbi:branched-chain-amino-acid aminotransferase [Fusarium napiforme]|uniref:Branched-chain-amino-acid aminotransferase n=1 Tax=Fusarium napiforme TaxID=42672 RepID=A0A8H5NAA1_9HYPO|nr:branched-chain-amino-acid aminotransferase [Fusarium napiforme]
MDEVFAGYAKRQATLQASTNILSQGIAWVEGEPVHLQSARIPLLDQGFMHSDLTHDVPSVWDGRFFRLDDHLDRLEASCKKMRLRFPIPRNEIKKILVEMVAKSEIKDAFVELVVTRGLKGYHGGRAIIARTVRRVPPGSIDPTIKNLQWGDLVRGLFEANDRGATYPFLTDGAANLAEGSGFNVVIIKNGVLYTPDRGVLQGITRQSVIDAARSCGYEIRIEHVPVESAYQADEILMCTTAGGIMPITTLDDKPVNDGKVGPITKAIWDRYWAMHWEDEFSFKIDY